MDENISHAIALMGATLLFMAAFSLSVIFYDGLKTRADEFFEATTLGARQEDATTIIMDRNDLERKIRFEEIFLAILNLPAYVSGDGNTSDSKIILGYEDASGDIVSIATYTASYDIDSNLKIVELTGSGYGSSKSYIVEGVVDPTNPRYQGKTFYDLSAMLKDFAPLALAGADTSGGSSNNVLKANKTKIMDQISYSIKYSDDAIIYVRN